LENYINYTDDQLLVLLKEKEPTKSIAFKVIWDRYSNSLMQYCCYNLEDDTEIQELFQNTWITFYEVIIKEQRVKSLKAFLFKIANYLLINQNRAKRVKMTSNLIQPENLMDSNPLLIEKIENNELISNFNLALKLIQPPTNEYLMLYWIGGMSFKEISEMYEEPYDNIRMKCTRGMDKVLKILEPIFKEKKLKEN
jgi:RNA polymerase sigma-70 factor (ECF subfamily)